MVNFDPNYVGNGKRGRYVVPSQKTLAYVDPRYIAYGVVTADKLDLPALSCGPTMATSLRASEWPGG